MLLSCFFKLPDAILQLDVFITQFYECLGGLDFRHLEKTLKPTVIICSISTLHPQAMILLPVVAYSGCVVQPFLHFL